MYTDTTAQFNALCAGSVTTEDWPLRSAQISTLSSATGCPGNSFILSKPVEDHGYFEIEIDQSNNFWGCNFSFGNSQCGVEIRQAFAHLLGNKITFTTDSSSPCAGTGGPFCRAIDTSVPPSNNLVSPIACSYDQTGGSGVTPLTESGSGCVVGRFNAGAGPLTGGTAYDCQSATSCTNPATGTSAATGGCGVSTATSPQACTYAWQPRFGSVDFCAAAQHLINAGLATGKDTSCVLTGRADAKLTGNPINIFIRQDAKRNQLGKALIQDICAVFTGAFAIGCSTSTSPANSGDACPNQATTTTTITNQIICATQGPITSNPAFVTSNTGTPLNNWWLGTFGFLFVFPFDVPIYFAYDSQFATQTTGSTCTSEVLTTSPGDYQYVCDPVFDAYAAQLEFAGTSAGPCPVATVGADPTSGSTAATFGTCQGTSPEFVVGAGASVTQGPAGAYTIAITITGIGGFSGTGTLAASSGNTAVASITSGASQSVALAPPAGGDDAITRQIVVTSTSTAGTATILVSVTIGTTTKSINFPVIVAPGTNPSTVDLCSSSSNCTSINAIIPSLSAVSAGYLAELEHGNHVLTLPVWSNIDTFAYQGPPTACLNGTSADCNANGYRNMVNELGIGATANFYEWLNAWNACPSLTGGTSCSPGAAINVGFSQTPGHLSPYSASTVWELYIYGNIWDSIYATNPMLDPSGGIPTSANGALIDWMTKTHKLCSIPSTDPACAVAPGDVRPAGTVAFFRNTLRGGITFHDGQPVTSFDVAMSYKSLIETGSFQAGGLLGIVTGITVLSTTQFDINVARFGAFTESGIGGVTVLPGYLWASTTCSGVAAWTAQTSALTLPYTAVIGSTSNPCFVGGHTGSTFDPVSAGIMVGSGPWVCESTSATTPGVVGTGCTSSGSQSSVGNGAYTLTRNGCTITSAGTQCVKPGLGPGATANGSVSSTYFRSPGTFARYIWSGITGSAAGDLSTVGTASSCTQSPGVALVVSAACARWQNGIGSFGALAGGYTTSPDCNGTNLCNVELGSLGIIGGFGANYGNWVNPIAFPYTTSTLVGTSGFPLTLYEGAATLTPASPQPGPANCGTGWTFSNAATVGYDC